jgi:hypothetical protein
MMTRKDYVAVAGILNGISENPDHISLVYKFVDLFQNDNPNFDEFRFVNACGLDIQAVK